ncbi:uncharacterized protein septin12 isoform X1 [Halichoeres trimaculatus]|uniref:uncharacterized protein septin12 isoform X1 n=2 Tax=Halichoeres trimaculatus TaxID=147232 RepID=UPI003D9DF7D1
MSELSVNDHLEGILSDFEALKRSFDVEDVEAVPSFLPDCPGSAPRESSLPPSLAFTGNNSLGSTAHHSHISLSSKPSPGLKSRTIGSSLSFNRGTMMKPAIVNNGSSVTRAASFQSRLNPNGYSMFSGPGSDNDSLHSSTSSLEYTSGVGSALPFTKPGSYPSPPSHQQTHQQGKPQQHQDEGANLRHNPNLKKFSSHNNVFHSEMDQGPGVLLGPPESRGVNHGSMPSLDLQNCDRGGGMLGMQRGGVGTMMSPGLRYANANVSWNGCLHNNTYFGEEGSKTNWQRGSQVPKTPKSKAKETPRLNKFPLDLDSFVTSTSPSLPVKTQEGYMNPNPPKPPLRSKGLQHPASPPSTPASCSASLSSLDSSSDTPPLSAQQPFEPSYLCSPTLLQRSVISQEMSSPLGSQSPAPDPYLEILSELKVVPEVLNSGGPYSSPSSGTTQNLEDGVGCTRDSVGSILRRIASFQQQIETDTSPSAEAQPSVVQSNGGFPSSVGHAGNTAVLASQQWKKNKEEAAGEGETDLLSPMEERLEKERGIMGPEKGGEDKTQGPAAAMNTQESMTERGENCVGLCAELDKKGKEKGMEEEEMIKESELDVKLELSQSVHGLQMSFISGRDLFGYVGIEAVLDQMRRKTMKAGFEFNIMVVGQSGLGKSTLVNTLFKSKVSRKSCTPNFEEKISKTVKLHSVSHVIEEKGVKMKLTVIDTPGFGDNINNENCWEPIVKYVNDQYEKYLLEELNVNRKRRIPDSRVHCCIYFLPATGHRLRTIDIEFMKRLGNIVSIVPVIAKADTLTIDERQDFKERIRQDLTANGICVYPLRDYDEDPEERILNDRIRDSIPFAVVGTDKEHQVNGNKVLGRKTKWGIIEVENVAHCEFANLRDLLIRSHLQDLKDVTHNIHYETYRVQRLSQSNMNFNEQGLSTWLLGNGTGEKYESDSHL